jgi:hypothetical protein
VAFSCETRYILLPFAVHYCFCMVQTWFTISHRLVIETPVRKFDSRVGAFQLSSVAQCCVRCSLFSELFYRNWLLVCAMN